MRKHVKDLLIPHKENDYKPHALQRMAVAVMLALILVSFTTANLQALLWIGSDWLVSTILPSVVVEHTNDERSVQALASLERNTVLDRAAQLKAEHMAEEEYFAHYAPDGTSPWHWFDEVSYSFVHAGENLAVHFTDSDEVVRAWMDSPGHRANILNGNYTEIGVGTARGEYQGYDTVFVVQLFGTPAAAAAPAPQEGAAIAESSASAPEPEPEQNDDVTLEVATEDDDGSDVSPASFETVSNEQATDTDAVEDAPEATSSPDTAKDVDVVVVYSDLATTTRDAVPATTTVVGSAGGGTEAPTLARAATQPNVWLQVVYGVLALFVVVALAFSIVIEWRRQHPVQIAYGTGLLAVMALLFYVHTTLTSGVTIV